MQRALHLAAETVALASPNPQVGCVLVKNDQIIGEGAHLYEHRDHAEIVALKRAFEKGIDVTGSTAYVTLEPCAHHGRTPPCADALIQTRIARCVVATVDPNPLVSGQGIDRLRAAGIEVNVGTAQQAARDLNDAFAHFIQRRTPFVTLKAALSSDGKLAPAPANRIAREPYWITGPAARAEVHRLRHANDAVLTGVGTVLADNPALTDRSGLPRRRPLLRVILDTLLRTPIDSELLRTGLSARREGTPDLLILYATPISPKKFAALQASGAELLEISITSKGVLDLPEVLMALADRNITSLLLECGSQLNGAFLTQDLVDKAALFFGPTTLGDEALPFAHGFESPFIYQQPLLRATNTDFGPDALITGYLHDPWQTVSSHSPADTPQ
jgi:diaminohydroxyphosphoribosylaminopyrimidine deaminase/5-amino-6-(5-phosphoribosylamino)uracil reductase